jgi:hypothetical protein
MRRPGVPYLRRGWFILSTCWLLFLLEPLSSTGLAFPFFLVTFGVTLLFGIVSLVFGLTRSPLNRFRILAWFVYPLAASSLCFSSCLPSHRPIRSSVSAFTSASQRWKASYWSLRRVSRWPDRCGWGSSLSDASTSMNQRSSSYPTGAELSMNAVSSTGVARSLMVDIRPGSNTSADRGTTCTPSFE